VIPIVQRAYAVLKDAAPLLEYQKNTVLGLEYEAGYSDYWNSTAVDDGETRQGASERRGGDISCGD
jgi:hypothetical protein